MTVLQGEDPCSPLLFACRLSWTEVAKPTDSFAWFSLQQGWGWGVLILLWILLFKNTFLGSLFWLGLHASTAEGKGSVSSQGTKILQALQHGQRKRNLKN